VGQPDGTEGDWLGLVENGPEYDARKRRLRRRFTGQRDAITLCDHRHQRVPLNIKALNARLAPVLGKAQHDMVMHLRPPAAATSHEVFVGKLGPPHTFRFGQRMTLREREEESLRPQRLRMAIAGRRRTHDKGDVKPRIANFPNGVARSTLDHLQIDGGVLFTKLTQELGKKASRD
jgi:hypothetical protein